MTGPCVAARRRGEPVALVMAKAPAAGKVKTRLAAAVGHEQAARLALAALLDTVEACERAYDVGRCYLALAGELDELDPWAAAALRRRLHRWRVIEQRGTSFAERLQRAHQEVHRLASAPVVQVGMDTPHLDPAVLVTAGAHASQDRPALGLAEDGGWWVLASTGPGDVLGLADVPMSTAETGDRTLRCLRAANPDTRVVPSMRDVDDAEDAEVVAAVAPGTRFARLWCDVYRPLEPVGEP